MGLEKAIKNSTEDQNQKGKEREGEWDRREHLPEMEWVVRAEMQWIGKNGKEIKGKT